MADSLDYSYIFHIDEEKFSICIPIIPLHNTFIRNPPCVTSAYWAASHPGGSYGLHGAVGYECVAAIAYR